MWLPTGAPSPVNAKSLSLYIGHFSRRSLKPFNHNRQPHHHHLLINKPPISTMCQTFRHYSRNCRRPGHGHQCHKYCSAATSTDDLYLQGVSGPSRKIPCANLNMEYMESRSDCATCAEEANMPPRVPNYESEQLRRQREREDIEYGSVCGGTNTDCCDRSLLGTKAQYRFLRY